MPSSRHLSRVVVMQTLFAYEFGNTSSPEGTTSSPQARDPEALLEYVASEYEEKITDLAFAYELLNGVLRHLPESRALIEKYAPQWPIEKIAPIDRAILEIGIFELLHSHDVPPVVAMDEAIELAKTFGNENSQKFVNGVLNAIYTAHRAPQEARTKSQSQL